jgi:hypothetical protein
MDIIYLNVQFYNFTTQSLGVDGNRFLYLFAYLTLQYLLSLSEYRASLEKDVTQADPKNLSGKADTVGETNEEYPQSLCRGSSSPISFVKQPGNLARGDHFANSVSSTAVPE